MWPAGAQLHSPVPSRTRCKKSSLWLSKIAPAKASSTPPSPPHTFARTIIVVWGRTPANMTPAVRSYFDNSNSSLNRRACMRSELSVMVARAVHAMRWAWIHGSLRIYVGFGIICKMLAVCVCLRFMNTNIGSGAPGILKIFITYVRYHAWVSFGYRSGFASRWLTNNILAHLPKLTSRNMRAWLKVIMVLVLNVWKVM